MRYFNEAVYYSRLLVQTPVKLLPPTTLLFVDYNVMLNSRVDGELISSLYDSTVDFLRARVCLLCAIVIHIIDAVLSSDLEF